MQLQKANNGNLRYEYRKLKGFLWNHRWNIVLTCIIFLLIYGYWIFDLNPHIDTEDFINTPYSVYGLQSGRPGKVFYFDDFQTAMVQSIYVECIWLFAVLFMRCIITVFLISLREYNRLYKQCFCNHYVVFSNYGRTVILFLSDI